jgi:hypothetical protein
MPPKVTITAINTRIVTIFMDLNYRMEEGEGTEGTEGTEGLQEPAF